MSLFLHFIPFHSLDWLHCYVGHSKPGLARIFGEEIVQSWRGGLKSKPPPMSPEHLYWHGRERKYRLVYLLPLITAPCQTSLKSILMSKISFFL